MSSNETNHGSETDRSAQTSPSGKGRATSELFDVLYDQLRTLASAYVRNRGPDCTLGTTALVHEAFVKLSAGRPMDWECRTHFFSVAAKAMRHVLIDYYRARNAAKRGGKAWRIRIEDAVVMTGGPDVKWDALARALEELVEKDPRAATVVELRFFGGLTGQETADALGLSRTTVDKDWRHAKAWLRMRLAEES